MEMTVSAHLLKITADCRACNNLVKEIQSKAPGPEETGKTGDTHTQKKLLLRARVSLGVTRTWILIVSKILGSLFQNSTPVHVYVSAKHSSLSLTNSFLRDVANDQK